MRSGESFEATRIMGIGEHWSHGGISSRGLCVGFVGPVWSRSWWLCGLGCWEYFCRRSTRIRQRMVCQYNALRTCMHSPYSGILLRLNLVLRAFPACFDLGWRHPVQSIQYSFGGRFAWTCCSADRTSDPCAQRHLSSMLYHRTTFFRPTIITCFKTQRLDTLS